MRDYAAAHGLAGPEAIEAGMRERAEAFHKTPEIYVPVEDVKPG